MKNISMGELEQQVMEILWERKKCTPREILQIIEKDRKLAYTTVATILQRLFEKGLLSRKEDKNVYIYTPKVTKQKYSKSIAQSFLKKFINSYGDTAIASFAESIDNLPEKKRKYFLDLLDGYDKYK